MSPVETPSWFIQTEDGRLFGYYSKDILLCDLAANKQDRVKILQHVNGLLRNIYIPITQNELQERFCSLCNEAIPADADPHEISGEGEEMAHMRCAQDQ